MLPSSKGLQAKSPTFFTLPSLVALVWSMPSWYFYLVAAYFIFDVELLGFLLFIFFLLSYRDVSFSFPRLWTILHGLPW